MDNLAHSEIFALTLVIGTYLTSLALYKKVHISLLHPLLTTIFVIIVVLEVLGIQYESFQQSSHLIHFMLGPSVVALGYVLYEQIQYLKGNGRKRGRKLSFHSYSSSHFFTLIQFIAYYIFPSISSYPPVKYLTNFLWFFPVFRAEKTS